MKLFLKVYLKDFFKGLPLYLFGAGLIANLIIVIFHIHIQDSKIPVIVWVSFFGLPIAIGFVKAWWRYWR